jgi:hypothetical protein
MKKELIQYEQAVALKELGFNESCFGYYYTLNGKDWKFAEKSEYYRLDDEINIGSKFSLLAPTFSQAFRWFREKYGLYAWITMELGNKSTFCWVLSGEHTSTQYAAYFNTYEEAELACLIKLIEIVKTK